jgi:hypothetical protein
MVVVVGLPPAPGPMGGIELAADAGRGRNVMFAVIANAAVATAAVIFFTEEMCIDAPVG